MRGPNIKVPDDRPMWGGLDFRLGSKCEELNRSKSRPPCSTERTSTKRSATSLMGHERTLGHGATLRALSLRADQQVATREGSDWGKAIKCPRRW